MVPEPRGGAGIGHDRVYGALLDAAAAALKARRLPPPATYRFLTTSLRFAAWTLRQQRLGWKQEESPLESATEPESKQRRNCGSDLFERQFVRTALLGPGQFLDLRFQTTHPATITLLAAERRPTAAAVLEQAYLLELHETAQPVPLARKESLRGVVVTTLTETVTAASGPREWTARLHNTGAFPQELSLLVVVA